MPFLRDEGPPIPQASIQRLRESLPVEYGWSIVNETGREVLVVRVPKAKPDYLHDLAEVAFYVGLDSIRATKDILLIGHEKTARLEPQLLRDHIRAQAREDTGVVDHLRRQLDRQYGHTFVVSPSNRQHAAFSVRIPKESVAQFTPEDVTAIRQLVTNLRPRVMDCQYAYIVANVDHERLGRRTLLELIGDAAEAPATEAAAPAPFAVPTPASAPVAQAPPPAAAMPVAPVAAAAHSPFPTMAALPQAAAAQPAPAPFASASAPVRPGPKTPSFIAAAMTAPPNPAPSAAPMEDAEVTDHEEYTIVSKPKPKEVAVEPVTPPAPAPTRASADAEVHEEYEIVSKPRTVEPTSPGPAPSSAHEMPSAAHAAHGEDEKTVLREEKEFEVFVSKPKARVETGPAITPPGKGGFQAALAGSTGTAPARTKEYEIIGRMSVTTDPSIASKLRLPSATATPHATPFTASPSAPATEVPMHAAVFHPPTPTVAAPTGPPPISASLPPVVATPPAPADSGAPIVARLAPPAPEVLLAQRFRDSGYEVVDGLRAQGTVFAFAAHKPNGRRVLVKRTDSFAAEDATQLAQLVAALGADVALVVADTVRPGTRIATWGTRIEVVTPADVPDLSF